MKIFRISQDELAAIGFGKDDVPFKNELHFRGIIVSSIGMTTQLLYLLYEAETVGEYMLSVFTIIVGVAIFASYFTTIFKINEMSNFIDSYQKFIEESKCNRKIFF